MTISGQHLTIDFQNENLIARCGETVLCTVPDLICILERDTATPINTELLRYGFRVVVVAFPAPAQLDQRPGSSGRRTTSLRL